MLKMLFLILSLLMLSSVISFPGIPTSCQNTPKPMSSLSDRSSSDFDLSEASNNTAQRRDVLAGLLAAIPTTAASCILFVPPSFSSDASSRITPTTTSRLSTVDQAVDLIASSCDPRFLRGVVASGYKCMYRGISPKQTRSPFVSSERSDLLLPSTYDSAKAAEFFASLDAQMLSQPVKPSNGHIAVTSIKKAKLWGGAAASIWPLDDNVHFAWLEKGGEFWTGRSDQYEGAKKVIVDGVDCEGMSLEDALESDNLEIMFRADRFLEVPVKLEKELLSRLQREFII